ncbi:MAG: carbohydrate kinase family protein, partial [bacterium]|nr:carbohydrate kinase family protein [bacterium]
NFDIVCLGDATLDLFFFINDASVHGGELDLKYGSKIPVDKFAKSLGGNAANVSVGLSRLGLKTALITAFGNDDTGAYIKRKLMEENVDISFSITPETRQSNTSSIIVFKNERTILTYHDCLNPSDIEVPQSKWFYLTNVFFDVNLLPKDAKIAFNPGVREIKKGKGFLNNIFSRTEILFVNKEECEAIGETNIKTVVVTDAVNGARVYDSGKEFFQPTLAGEIVETTGAGDAFASGFLAARFYGKTIEEQLLWGAKNSASVISKIGAIDGLLKHVD